MGWLSALAQNDHAHSRHNTVEQVDVAVVVALASVLHPCIACSVFFQFHFHLSET